ncbi:hypothetical protein H7992_04265 [Sporosarcina sp. resist]|nr:hypothetical protein H7992_04265 [Sporosarcina sp. resist]
MKILAVDLFQDGLQCNITMLDRLSGEMEAIHHAVEGLVQMEEQFKGAGGNATRSFYQECHLPFLFRTVQTSASADGGSTSFTRT